jgi:hypothetical protein
MKNIHFENNCNKNVFSSTVSNGIDPAWCCRSKQKKDQQGSCDHGAGGATTCSCYSETTHWHWWERVCMCKPVQFIQLGGTIRYRHAYAGGNVPDCWTSC